MNQINNPPRENKLTKNNIGNSNNINLKKQDCKTLK